MESPTRLTSAACRADLLSMLKLPKEPSDPTLKLAMAEIVAVLKKHDIAGIAVLQSKTHGEWLNEITASWTCTQMETDGTNEVLRVRAKVADYPSKEAQQETVRLTVSMLCGFRDGAGRIKDNMESLLALLSGQMEIEHISRFDQ